MTEVHIIALLCTGLVQGLSSGVLGTGGGWITTPVQYWVYQDMGIAPDLAIRMAFATGLLAMLPAGAASAWGHHRRSAVWWKPALVMGICGLAGSFSGATLATHVSATPLKVVFGVAVLAVGFMMLVSTPSPRGPRPRENAPLWAACAFPITFLAGMIGVGGGLFMVPVMVLLFHFPMHMAVATSVATVAAISIGGMLGYVVNGMGVAGIPSPSVGYVYVWGWLCLVGTGVLMTQVGVSIAHRLPARTLAWVFSAAALYIGLRMIGLFEWLDWPL